MWELSDESLLTGMAAGDPETAAVFVRRYQARVYGLAYTLVGSSAIAEEVAQEAFLRAWRHAGAYDPRKGRAVTWLLTITRNLAVDALRLRADRPVDPHLLLTTLTGAERAAPPGTSFEDAEELREALRALPREQSTPIVLSVFYGLTVGEIADREHIPLGTAKTRLRRGLARLREALGVTHD
ncbi:sigma-70 family RNA polymerase sigma factor [Actinomadura nitritigenes]|uniref:RNA polymerase sigma factor n=1 Tax=Actinomadura nitritigenes TaxID=134602 RepID=A0ABS3RBC4_9ACTN|nr:RNA polymerase sigma factor [Actinomadura nitritigenes]MBO2442913.1 RNA polymerase sigma factor [Actinomadura nitritigenes]